MNKRPIGQILEQDYMIPGGYTRQSLADELGYSKVYIANIVTNKAKISSIVAEKLVSVFPGTSTDFWMGQIQEESGKMTSVEMISVVLGKVGNEEAQLVDARQLHQWLEVGKHFRTWIQERIEQYGFIEEVDFVVQEDRPISGATPKKDYIITLDMAKELAMVERNSKGKEARLYFIACEKKAQQIQPKVMTLAEQILMMAQLSVEQERKFKEHEEKFQKHDQQLLQIQAKMDDVAGKISSYTASAYCKLRDIAITDEDLKVLGKAASQMCREHGVKIDTIPSKRFVKVNVYPIEILDIAVIPFLENSARIKSIKKPKARKTLTDDIVKA